jgi:hypothetical protein
MKRSLSALGALAFMILAACTGDPGPPGPPGAGEPSVSAIVPGRAFLARTVDVTISGSGTRWDDATTVSFGDGVTIDRLVVASPTAIVASITVADGAPLGPRDVTVTAGDEISTYKGAFAIDSPLGLSVRGTPAQGSLVFVTANGKDLSTPFDTTSEGGLFSAPSFLGIAIDDIAGAEIEVSNVSLYKVDFLVILDVDAAPGPRPLTLMSGLAEEEQISFPSPAGFDVAAREPVALVSGTWVEGNVETPFESHLYTFTPSAGLSIVDVDVQSNELDAGGLLLPASGRFADRLTGFTTATMFLSSSADRYYVVAMDLSGGTGRYGVTARSTAATGVSEAASNDTSDVAQALASLPAVVQNATLSSEADEDWYQITATAAEVGKRLRISTVPGDPGTDTVVEAFLADGTTPFGDAVDDNYHETFISPAIPAAESYLIRITASTESAYSAAQSRYSLIVRVE